MVVVLITVCEICPSLFQEYIFFDRRIDILSPLSEGMSISGYVIGDRDIL